MTSSCAALEDDRAGIGDLPARLGVERRPVEHELADLALGEARHGRSPTEQCQRARLGLEGLVGQPLGGTVLVQHGAVDTGVAVGALLGARVGLGALALLGHQPAEALLVDLQALLGGHLEGQVDREPVGVVQLERAFARQGRAARLLHVVRGGVEDLGAGLEGLAERVLLGEGHLRDALPVGDQVGVGRAHRVARDRHQLGEHPVLTAEQAHRAHGTAQQSAQDVAATVVAGGDAVTDQHHR